jgi:hypothetical protein
MREAGIFFSVLFVALILAPGVAAWFLSFRGFSEGESRATGTPIVQFPSQHVADSFIHSHIDAA